MSPLRIWLMAARPRTLPAAIAPVLVGTAAALYAVDDIRWGAFFAALAGSILIQIGTNLANDYSDAKRGADTAERLGPVRVTSSGLVAPRRVLYATWIAFAAALGVGIYLATVAGWEILVVGAVSIAAGILYTGGPRPYGYAGLGEVFVFLFFGLVAVNGSYYVQLEDVDLLPFLLSIPVGLLSTAILVVNNVRDLDTDARAGKHTLAVRLGRERTRDLYVVLVAGAFVLLPLGLWLGDGPAEGLIALAATPLALSPVRAVRTRTDGPALNGALAATGMLLAAFSVLLAAGLLLGLMLVERVETIPYALPFREPYVTARGTLERREMILLRLRTDDGPEGLGEAVPLSLRAGDGLAEVDQALLEAGQRLIGLDLNPGEEEPLAVAVATFLELVRPRKLPPPAAAALECALFDLAAKELDEPLWATLRASEAKPVETNATLTTAPPDALVAQAESWAAEGFRTFKLKLGAGDDVAGVAAVREVVGPDARIRVDANEAWEPDEAIEILGALEPHGIELAEQPVTGLRWMARVAREVAIPLAADESVNDEADAHRAVQRRACAFATAKLAKVGGMGTARQIAAVLPTYLSSALDGPVGIGAAAHAAQVLREGGLDPGIAHGLATQRLFAETVASRECDLRDGHLHLPDGPGLGVEIDEAALERFRITG